MKKAWIIAQKELQTFFDSLIAYILLIAFLGFSGFFTWLYGTDIFLTGEASLSPFFQMAYWTLFFFIPALTMRMMAEENNTGTIELLLTKAANDRQVITGKFIACILLIAIALVLTLPYYITVANLGNVDHGVIWCGYLGLLLMSMAYTGIGLFASSTTSNQIVAFLGAVFISVFFHILFGVLANSLTGSVAQVFNYLSMSTHFESITRGVIDSADLIYFLSLAFLGLGMAELVMAKRNVTE